MDVAHAKRTVRRGVRFVSISPADLVWLPDESVSLVLQSGGNAPAETMATGQRFTFGHKDWTHEELPFSALAGRYRGLCSGGPSDLPALSCDPRPGHACADNTSALLVDVALDASGRLSGQIVDSSGKPLATQSVSVQSVASDRPMRAVSDRAGRFVLEGLSGGVSTELPPTRLRRSADAGNRERLLRRLPRSCCLSRAIPSSVARNRLASCCVPRPCLSA